MSNTFNFYLFVTKFFLIHQLIQKLQKSCESHEIHRYVRLFCENLPKLSGDE